MLEIAAAVANHEVPDHTSCGSAAPILVVQLLCEDPALGSNLIRDADGNVVARGYPKSMERTDPKNAIAEKSRFLEFAAVANSAPMANRSAGPYRLELLSGNRSLATNIVSDAKGNVVARGHPRTLQYAQPDVARAEQQRLIALVKAVNHDIRRMR